MKPRFADVMTVDSEQWSEWKSKTPAERLDEYCRLWIETYELRENARTNFRMAVKKGFRKPRKP